MLSPRSLTKPLILSLCALAVSACETPGRTFQAFPPAADLVVEAKPVPHLEVVTSAQAAAAHNIALESWGERGWRAVARICRWAEANGAEALDCSPPD